MGPGDSFGTSLPQDWMRRLIVAPLEKSGIVPASWVDSVVMNDYSAAAFSLEPVLQVWLL